MHKIKYLNNDKAGCYKKGRRLLDLRPLTNFLVQYLRHGSYWTNNTHGIPDPGDKIFKIKFMGFANRHMVIDNSSDPIQACMIVERLISSHPTMAWGNSARNVYVYRVIIASWAFGQCFT